MRDALNVLTTALLLVATSLFFGCSGGNGAKTNTGGGGTASSPSVTVSPASVNVFSGTTQQFTATVENTNSGVNWSVNGVSGGNATVGTVTLAGLYTAPNTVPNPSSLTVTCTINGTQVSANATVIVIEHYRIAYTGTSGTSPGVIQDIYVANSDGSNVQRLTYNPIGQNPENLMPTWSPDRSKIAFVSNRDGTEAIYVMNADGSDQTKIQNGLDYSIYPAWSPDGSKIAFVGRFTNEVGIATMNENGSDVVQLTHVPCPEGSSCQIPGHPDWSPDGTKIAFDTPVNGYSAIYAMNSDGTSQTDLTNDPTADDMAPSWSPDGSQIAFMSDRGGHMEVYVMDVSSGAVRQLTQSPCTSQSDCGSLYPDWSEDGSRLVFQRGCCFINVINADGTGDSTIVGAGIGAGWPAWKR